MLTLFFGDSAKAFQKILTHFVIPPAKILDITYGNGNSWKGFEFNTLNGKYELTKCDIRKEKDIDLLIDIRKPLPNEFTESFDCVYFDPPYYFKETVKDFNIEGNMYEEEEEVFWTEKDMQKALQILKTEIPRVLKKGGVLITKIMDGYQGKDTYFPNHYIFYNIFTIFLKPEATFIVPIHRRNIPNIIKTNHIYYQVFKKL